MELSNQRRYFHTFDALRFFAFLLVFFTHLPLPEELSWLSGQGGNGVRFFFVLSGFLITYILVTALREAENRRVVLINFFVRRVLRIWPLYFACLLFAFLTPYILGQLGLTSSENGYQPNWLTSGLFLENYQMIISNSYPNVSPLRVTWSICIEEHFYLLWTTLFGLLSWKRTRFILLAALLLPLVIRPFYYYYLNWPFLDLFSTFDFFAWGGILAWMIIEKPRLIDRIECLPVWCKYVWLSCSVLLLAATKYWSAVVLQLAWPLLLAPAFVGILAFTLPVNNRLHVSDHNWFSRWGKYTYGLYLLHTIVINLLLRVVPETGLFPHWLIVCSGSFVLSLLAAYGSYHLLEKPFVRLKRYFR